MNNHCQFLLFVSTLVIGVYLFDYLTYTCQLFLPAISHLPFLSQSTFVPSRHDSFLVSVASWATLQLLWAVILLASQLWQVARQMTSLDLVDMDSWVDVEVRIRPFVCTSYLLLSILTCTNHWHSARDILAIP